MANITLNCDYCNKDFVVPFKQRDKKYCGRECYFSHAREGRKIGRPKDETLREMRSCKVCGSEFEVKKSHFKTMCSDKCRLVWANKPENRKKQQDNIKKTVLEKYGVEHVWKSEEIHKKTMNNRDTDSMVRKQKETVLKKQLKKLKENNINLLGDYKGGKDNLGHKTTSRHYKFQCIECNNIFTSTVLGSGKIPKCPKCFPSYKNSELQLFVESILNEYGIAYIKNDRLTIPPYELDFLLPSKQVAIEVHGVYWHGESKGKDRNYHLNKTKLCQDKGIKLIQIFEDEIYYKPEIVKSKIEVLLGVNVKRVYGRKCIINEIDYETKKQFLDKTHLQGNSKDSIKLGLFHEGILVSVMTLGKRKITRGKSNWELIRYSVLPNHVIVGGFSKLLNYVLKNYDIKELMTYADIRWSGIDITKTVYNNCGFKFVENTSPNYWYVYNGEKLRRHRYSFRKDVLTSEGHDPSKTEWEIMHELGYDRVWDCGNIKFIYFK